MPSELAVKIGQFSDKGRKAENQDFYGALVPKGSLLALKGVSAAVADGVSLSRVSRVAAETAVKSFLTDYYSTPEAWTVKTSGRRVISATNSWLHGETARGYQAEDLDRGYMCTLSALVLKGRMAHVLHVGDSRVSRLSGEGLEPLTADHRVVLSPTQNQLSRAMGRAADVEIDYDALPVSVGDVFILTTDGVHDFVEPRALARSVLAYGDDLDGAARAIVQHAIDAGSHDNATIQIVRVDALPEADAAEFVAEGVGLPYPKVMEVPTEFEGYRLEERIHASTRSFIYLGEDTETGARIVLKIPGEDLRETPGLLAQMMIEEWVARRLNSPFILKAHASERPRNYIYVVTEHVDGENLRRWMKAHPKPDPEAVRDIINQIAMGLRAFHRKEMLHRDLRPENIMIARDGTAKIIDFGSVRIAGVAETAATPNTGEALLGHMQYTAPEVFVGQPASWRSDQFSLGVIAYEMLTGELPFGEAAARVRSPAQQAALRYVSAMGKRRDVPQWVDGALRTATEPDPLKRYGALSDFIHDLTVPNQRFTAAQGLPLARAHPVRFWQGVSAVLALICLVLTALLMV